MLIVCLVFVAACGVLGWIAGWLSKSYFDGVICSDDRLSDSALFMASMSGRTDSSGSYMGPVDKNEDVVPFDEHRID